MMQKLIFGGILLPLLCVLGIHRLQFIAEVARRPSHSFVNYYTASVLLVRGAEVSQYYDDAWYMAQTAKITPGIEDIYTPHPPTMALLLLPLAHQNYNDARIIWTLFNLILVSGAVGWILWTERFSMIWGAIALIVVFMYQPLYANFEYGQIYGLLFAAFTAIGYGYKHQYDRPIGIVLGLMVIMKAAGWLLFPLWILKRRWKIVFWSSITICVVGLMSLPIVGLQSWLTFFDILPEYSQRPSFAVTAYQSIPSFFKHHFFYHPIWNPTPLIDLPALGTLLSFCVIVALLGITFWKRKHDKQPMLTYCALILLSVIISPATLDYHYAIVLLPILLLLADIQSLTLWQKLWLTVAIFLLAVDYPYQKPLYSTSFLSLMAYPKLIGGLLLWGLTVR